MKRKTRRKAGDMPEITRRVLRSSNAFSNYTNRTNKEVYYIPGHLALFSFQLTMAPLQLIQSKTVLLVGWDMQKSVKRLGM